MISVLEVVPQVLIPYCLPTTKDEPKNNNHCNYQKTSETRALQDVVYDNFGKQPVTESSVNMLCQSCSEIKHIDGAYAPRIVVGILPVKHAIFPVIMIAVPPFAGIISVLVCILVDDGVDAIFSGIVGYV